MSGDDKRPLGRILLQRKLVPRELQRALREQSHAGAPPPSPSQPALEEGDDEIDALLELAERSGVPGLDLRQVKITLDHLDVVPREVAEALRILPVLLRDGSLFLAMADPHDKRAIDEVEFVTGRAVHLFIAVRARLVQTTADAYDAKGRGEREYRGSRAPPDSAK
jgi:hypothetical protein